MAIEQDLEIHTCHNWGAQVAANFPQLMQTLQCPCGKPIRHRGTCWFRFGSLKLKRPERVTA